MVRSRLSQTSIFVIIGSVFGAISCGKVCDSTECVIAAGRILSAMNRSADPCVSFYDYACGNYKIEENIPAGESGISPFVKTDLVLQKRMRTVLETPPPTRNESLPRQKIRQFYASCLNRTKINKNGIVKLRAVVQAIGGLILTPLDNATSKLPANWSLNDLLNKRNAYSFDGLFEVGVAPDDKNARVNIIQLDQGGLGLGDGSRDLYTNVSVTKDHGVLASYANLLQTYAVFIVGEDNVTRTCILDIVEFEQRLALIHDANDQKRDMAKIYNKVDIAWLNKNTPFLDWTAFFKAIFQPVGIDINQSEPIVLYATKHFKLLSNLVREYLATDTGKQVLQNYIVMQVVMTYAPRFGDAFGEAHGDFSAQLGGTHGVAEWWQKCIADFDSMVGYPLSAMLIEKYFSPETKKQAEEVVKNVIPSFRQRMSKASWLSADEMAIALDKLDSMEYTVAYPSWLFNDTYVDELYSNFTVTDDYTKNLFFLYDFLQNYALRQLRLPVDNDMWQMTPSTVNAYYESTHNNFIVPAGILSEPFFYPMKGAPLSLNYGAIGTIAAHEIAHSVDDIGRQYDKNGSLSNWWRNETVAAFEEMTQCLVDQYNSYRVANMNVRGLQTLGENIADNGGLKTAFYAYKNALTSSQGGGDDKTTSSAYLGLVGVDATPDQLFFLANAQVWCHDQSVAKTILGILMDEHPPHAIRVNGPMSNSCEFATAFNCPCGSAMNPAKKCSVW